VSIGHEDTFGADLFDRARLAEHLLDQADRVCARVRDHRLRARTVTVKVKYADHKRVSRRRTLPRATTDGRLVGETARALLAEVPDIEERGVRLTGISLSAFEPADAPEQLELGEKAAHRGNALGAMLDKIHEKFGDDAIQRADHLPKLVK